MYLSLIDSFSPPSFSRSRLLLFLQAFLSLSSSLFNPLPSSSRSVHASPLVAPALLLHLIPKVFLFSLFVHILFSLSQSSCFLFLRPKCSSRKERWRFAKKRGDHPKRVPRRVSTFGPKRSHEQPLDLSARRNSQLELIPRRDARYVLSTRTGLVRTGRTLDKLP